MEGNTRRSWILMGAAVMVGLTGFWEEARAQAAAGRSLEIRKRVSKEFIPIALEGYAAGVAEVLQYDLEIQGFKVVEKESAAFLLRGGEEGAVQGRLIDLSQRREVLAKAFNGSSERQQAHALSDAVVQQVTGRRGIARTRIAFRVRQNGKSEVYIADYDGFRAHPVTHDQSIVRAPSWVDGQNVLLYTSYVRNHPDVYRHDLTAGQRRPIARYLGTNNGAAASPDASKVAMILGLGGRGPDLYIVDMDGSNLKRLTRTEADESAPCWSPDGRSICVVSRKSGRAALYSIPPSGGELSRIRTIGVFNATEPSWSPDGRQIAFTTLRGGRFELCLVDARGGNVEDLGILGEDPFWAPNSRTLIFTKRRGNGDWTLSLLDVPTKQVKDVQHLISGDYSQPAWAN